MAGKRSSSIIPQYDAFTISNTMFSQTVKTLYPGAMIGTIGEAYFRTTKEMGCPRGVVS